jgi:hypothetical protein
MFVKRRDGSLPQGLLPVVMGFPDSIGNNEGVEILTPKISRLA